MKIECSKMEVQRGKRIVRKMMEAGTERIRVPGKSHVTPKSQM
jgi:hypothetical protein